MRPVDLDTVRLRHEIRAIYAAELLFVLESVGFKSVRIDEYFDPFGRTSKKRVARKYGVKGVNVHALKS